MGWPYSLSVSLSEEQQANRRRLLDAYGQFAQLSVLLLPLFYQLSLAIRIITSRIAVKSPPEIVKERRSPVATLRRQQNDLSSKGGWQWLRWWSEGEIVPGWGTCQHWLLALLWASWLLVLAVKDTEDDYLHITRRFGIVAASQLPLHYILAMKAWSPVQYITRMSHEELNPYHRLLGRIIVIFMACHATLYLNFYVQKGLLVKRIQDRDVILGLCAIWSAIIIFTSALARVRDYNYRLFFYIHVILSMTLLPILYFHVSHLRLYILEAATVYVVLVIQRNLYQNSVQATITRCKGANLICLTFPLTTSLSSRSYVPGQHVYITFPSLKEKLRLNPFTVANLPSQDHKFQIVARVLGGTTSILNRMARQPQPVPLLLEGPYGGAKYFPDFSNYNSVLLVAGGVGATFTLPIYRRLLASCGGDGSSESLRFIWTVKNQEDAAWCVGKISSDSEISLKGFELYLTDQRRRGHSATSTFKHGDDEIELEEREGLLDENETANDRLDVIPKDSVRKGRPNLGSIVDQTFTQNGVSRVAILVCGPPGMGDALRKEVGRWIGNGRDIFWHNEEFGL